MVYLDTVTALELGKGRPQMLVVDTPQPHFMARLVLLEREARIFLEDPCQCAAQLDVVLSVGRLDRERAIARWHRHLDRRRKLAGSEPVAGLHAVDLGKRDNVAVASLADLGHPVALHLEQRPQPTLLAARGLEVAILLDAPAEHPCKGQSTNGASMVDLEGDNRGFVDAEPAGGRVRAWCLVAQRFQETPDAPAVLGRAEQHRHTEIVARLAREVGEDGAGFGHLVHQELLEQGIVMVSQLFEQLGPGLGFPVGKLLGQRDCLGRLAGHVTIGPLKGDIDEAGDLLAVADRYLPCDQRRNAHRLERGQQVADLAMGLVDPVDENEVGDAKLVEHPQRRGGEGRPGRIRIDDDDGKVGNGDAERRVARKADRAGRIDDRVTVAEIGEIVEIGFGGAAARPGFLTAVADARLVGDRTMPVSRTAGEEKCFGQGCLARAGRSDQRD